MESLKAMRMMHKETLVYIKEVLSANNLERHWQLNSSLNYNNLYRKLHTLHNRIFDIDMENTTLLQLSHRISCVVANQRLVQKGYLLQVINSCLFDTSVSNYIIFLLYQNVKLYNTPEKYNHLLLHTPNLQKNNNNIAANTQKAKRYFNNVRQSMTYFQTIYQYEDEIKQLKLNTALLNTSIEELELT